MFDNKRLQDYNDLFSPNPNNLRKNGRNKNYLEH